MYVNVAILKETQPGERRVAMVPAVVEKLVKLGARLRMQSGAGEGIGLSDTAFKDVAFTEDRRDLLADADVVLCINPPSLEVITSMKEGAILLSFIHAPHQQALVRHLLAGKITCFAMERIPRTTRAQSMDALSTQSALSGYAAVMMGAAHLGRILPKITTAAGAIGPAKVLVMGLGVAGLEAVATAQRLGAVVEGYDVRPDTREQVLSLGGTFVDTGVDATGAGGYARELTPAETTEVDAALTAHIQGADLVITTAAIPDRPAPKLITQAQVAGMKHGSVVIDLSAEGGGNCAASIPGKTTRVGHVTVVAPLNIPSTLAEDASELFAKNQLHFLELFLKDNIIKMDWTDEILAKTVLTHNGALKAAELGRVAEPSPKPPSPVAADRPPRSAPPRQERPLAASPK